MITKMLFISVNDDNDYCDDCDDVDVQTFFKWTFKGICFNFAHLILFIEQSSTKKLSNHMHCTFIG